MHLRKIRPQKCRHRIELQIIRLKIKLGELTLSFLDYFFHPVFYKSFIKFLFLLKIQSLFKTKLIKIILLPYIIYQVKQLYRWFHKSISEQTMTPCIFID